MSPFFVKKLMNQRACFLCAEKLPEIDQTGGVCRCLCTSGRQLLSVPVKKRIDGVSAGELKFIVTQITKTNLGYTLQKGSIDKLFRVGKSRSPQQIRSVFHEIQKVGLQRAILKFASESPLQTAFRAFTHKKMH